MTDFSIGYQAGTSPERRDVQWGPGMSVWVEAEVMDYETYTGITRVLLRDLRHSGGTPHSAILRFHPDQILMPNMLACEHAFKQTPSDSLSIQYSVCQNCGVSATTLLLGPKHRRMQRDN